LEAVVIAHPVGQLGTGLQRWGLAVLFQVIQ
jgi:hypothetical protein